MVAVKERHAYDGIDEEKEKGEDDDDEVFIKNEYMKLNSLNTI